VALLVPLLALVEVGAKLRLLSIETRLLFEQELNSPLDNHSLRRCYV
jgi:hypothetical protein